MDKARVSIALQLVIVALLVVVALGEFTRPTPAAPSDYATTTQVDALSRDVQSLTSHVQTLGGQMDTISGQLKILNTAVGDLSSQVKDASDMLKTVCSYMYTGNNPPPFCF